EKEIPVGIAPYSVTLKKSKAYVTNWGGRRPDSKDLTGTSSGSLIVVDKKTGIASSGTVSVIDLATHKVIREIPVHLHPSGMTMSPDSSRLYVANANSDLISVINTSSDKVIRSISTKPMDELPFGSAPNALVVSPDGQTLFVANAGNNLLAVIDLSTGKVKGLVPTGWYPSAVILSHKGSQLIVANTKGVGSRQEGLRAKGYSDQDHLGSVSFIPVPNKDTLEAYTIKAATNMRLPKITQSIHLERVKEQIVPVPTKPGEKSVFKHIIYIVKENRTYDQVFGDMPQGNGDSALCQFGRNTSPNHHSLAEKFVLLDNMYCNGVKSAEGHQWTSQGYVTDYLEKAFPDFTRSYPWSGDDPLVFASSGFIWDRVFEAGLKFRTYGEFVQDKVTPENATWTDIYTDYKQKTGKIKIQASAKLHTIRPYVCPTYTGSPRTINDQYKADEFIKELHAFEKNGSFPNLMMMSLPNDHTSGTQEDFPTPRAMVADNDLALGRIVEAVSKSKFWKETAIFVIEDDPQNGLDHVDGRRTISFCISPYTKRNTVISTHYNQNSILRTIELILGLAPMSQFDLIATPMVDCFTSKPDFTPYKVLPNNIPLDEMNPKLATLSGKQKYWAQKSMEMSLEVDEADEDTLNLILWYSVKGYDTP
ncbi:MAG TPA: alkaline phosphatase family protein, partial [Flavitalea sp.]|nr:alkaline phosphatase family protein [Flavitalea sp.]